MSEQRSDSIRLKYLQAMGVDVWIRRDQPQPVVVSENLTEKDGEPDVSVEQQWDDLAAEVSACQACSLSATRTQTVFGSGNRQAQWMLVGEAPGQQEDLEGKPFVGRAGLLLTEMIRALGLSREQVYITNILKCRPPGNRDPKSEEVDACSTYLQRQIKLVQPKIILAVGRIAAQNLLHTKEPLAKLRGVVHQMDDIPVVVIYHPAYLLRTLLEKRKAWQDLKFALRVFHQRKG